MQPRLSFTVSNQTPEADDYEWAEFNLPPVLCSAEPDIDDASQSRPVDHGLS